MTGFLAHSFDESLEYGTINTYRSALSGVLPPMEGFPVGQHPLVVRLLKGILNLCPAMPRYQERGMSMLLWTICVLYQEINFSPSRF